jgi:hypothetical protein
MLNPFTVLYLCGVVSLVWSDIFTELKIKELLMESVLYEFSMLCHSHN